MFQDGPGICQFVPLDHHPRLPTYSFFVPISNTTVPSPNLLALSILSWVSSFLGFFTTYLASILFISLFLFSPSCVQSLPFLIFFVTDLTRLFFSLPNRQATDFSSGRLAKNHRDPKIFFAGLNPGIRSVSSFKRDPTFFNKIPREHHESALLGTFFNGLMITKELSWSHKRSFPYLVDGFLILAWEKGFEELASF